MSGPASLILALDTSGADAGLALAGDGDVFVSILPTHQHGAARTEDLGIVAARLLGARGRGVPDLTLLAAVVGPGSYTGLRAGLAFLRGLAFGGSVPAVGVGSLELLAWRGGLPGETVVAAAPAGAGRCVAASYACGSDNVAEVAAPQIVEAEDFPDFLVAARGAGNVALIVSAPPQGVPADGAREQSSAIEQAARTVAIELRSLRGPALEQLVRLALARANAGLVTRVDELVPVYVGQSSARPNRHRVAVVAAAE